jgi:hypothetical protein
MPRIVPDNADDSAAYPKRQKFTFDMPDNGAAGGVGGSDWAIPQRITNLGSRGKLSRVVIRGPVTSTVTEISIKIWQGSGYDATTVPSNVPDEDAIYNRTLIVIAGSATVADDDYDILGTHSGAPYNILESDEDMWISMESTASTAADTDFVVSVEAVGVVE